MDITFYGVRGSTPCSGDSVRATGGNTSCVVVRTGDHAPIILDLGTGLRPLGLDLLKELGDQPFVGTALVTHLHWDHVQGLPFFAPLLTEGAQLTVVGPTQAGVTMAEAVRAFVAPPLFPVDIDMLPGAIDFVSLAGTGPSGSMTVDSATVTATVVQHCGPTNGYRIETADGSIAYLSDHQAPMDGSLGVPASVVELCAGVDVLIHDAQYDTEEFERKAEWGHSTIEYAVAVARAADVGRLVLFHHDPCHDDAWVREAVVHAQHLAGSAVEVCATMEGLTLRIGPDPLA